MSIKVHMKKRKRSHELDILKFIRIKIRDLPAVAQSVEHHRDKPRTWLQIEASVRFFICPVAFFLLCYPCEALEGPISSGFA